MQDKKYFKVFWLRIVTLLVLACSMLFFAAACKGGADKDTSAPEEDKSITFIEKSVSLERGDRYTFLLSGEKEGLTFTLSNENVVELDGMGIVAKEAGSVTVTLDDNGKTDTLSVLVSANYQPTISVQERVQIFVGGEYTIPVTVCYKEGYYTDLPCQYSVADSSIATVDESGNLKGIGKGNTEITVSCSYRFYTLTEKVSVSVLGQSVVAPNMSSILLTTRPDLERDKTNTASLSVMKAIDNGEEISASSVLWEITEGREVISLADGIVTANAFGSAKIKLSFTAKSGEEIYNYVTVTVTKPFVEYSEPITYYKNYEYLTMPESLGVGAGEVINVLAEGKEIAGEDLKIIYPKISASQEYMTWTVYTTKADYSLQVKVLTANIRSANDLLNAYKYTEYDKTANAVLGYIDLSADIDMSGVAWTAQNMIGLYPSTYGEDGFPTENAKGVVYDMTQKFNGVFDGHGFAIKNLEIKSGIGLISHFGWLGTFKNVDFENCIINTGERAGLVANLIYGGTFENLTVNFKHMQDGSKTASTLDNGNNQIVAAGGLFGYIYTYENVCYGDLKLKDISITAGDDRTGSMQYAAAIGSVNAASGANVASHIFMENVTFIGFNGSLFNYNGETLNLAGVKNAFACEQVVAYSDYTHYLTEGLGYTIQTLTSIATDLDADSGYIGKVDLSMLDIEGEIVSVTKDGVAVALENGCLIYEKADASNSAKNYVIMTENKIYNLSVTVWSKIINTAADLQAADNYGYYTANADGTVTNYAYYGYFTLGGNIDMSGVTWNSSMMIARTNSCGQNEGFMGVFDGAGYAIQNFAVNGGEHAGLIHRNGQGVICNLTVENASVSSANSGVLIGYAFAGTIENVTVEVNSLASNSTAALIGRVYNYYGGSVALTIKGVDVIWTGDSDTETGSAIAQVVVVDENAGTYHSRIVLEDVTVVGISALFRNYLSMGTAITVDDVNAESSVYTAWKNKVSYYTVSD